MIINSFHQLCGMLTDKNHNIRHQFIYLLLFFLPMLHATESTAQKGRVTAGPMPGYMEHRETVIWLQTQCAKRITIQYWLKDNPGQNVLSVEKNAADCKIANHHFVLENLHMGKTYAYRVLLDGKATEFPYPLVFKTKPLWEWRTSAPDFSFLVGSCLYVNDSAYDRPGKPYGQGTEILQKMNSLPGDFMLWLGDNTYTREPDYGSASGLAYRYQHTRADKNLQPFLASRNHYAIWDDHDYGSNDACKTYPLKEVTRGLFTDYWANKTYGEDNKGIYSMFSFSDADFFLLDDRYFRDYQFLDDTSNPNKTQLGEAQLQWLFNNLVYSRATFKFIAIGGQFLNEYTDKESYNFYKKERERILQFIITNKISGVIFLTGDRHHTELIKNTQISSQLGYPLYDLTSSAISSRASDISKSSEFNNPMRVENTLVMENNFCNITVSGSRGNRIVTLSCYDKDGKEKWKYSISENELRAQKK